MRGGDTPTLGVTRKTPAPWDSGPTREDVPSLQTLPHLASSALMNAKPVAKGRIFTSREAARSSEGVGSSLPGIRRHLLLLASQLGYFWYLGHI